MFPATQTTRRRQAITLPATRDDRALPVTGEVLFPIPNFTDDRTRCIPAPSSESASRPEFRCPLCSYTSVNQAGLTGHSRRHSEARPFSCPHCDQTYATMCGLRGHLLKSGLHPGRSLYHCAWCADFHTNTRVLMKRHLFERHPAIMPRNEPCIDINEILGIYHPELDSDPLLHLPAPPQPDPSPPVLPLTEKRPIAPRLTARGDGGRDKQDGGATMTISLPNDRGDEEKGRPRDLLIHAGIGLWTRTCLDKFL